MWDPNLPADLSAIAEEDIPQILDWFFNGVKESWARLSAEAYLMGAIRANTAMVAAGATGAPIYPNPAMLLSSDDYKAIDFYTQQTLDYVKKLEPQFREDVQKQIVDALKGKENPLVVAKKFEDVFDQTAGYYELLARTEIATAENAARFNQIRGEGEELCLITPHVGECEACARLISGRIFRVETLQSNLRANYGRKMNQWVPSCPQHPNCLRRGQKVITDRGEVNIEEVCEGDRVLTHRMRFRTVTRTFRSNAKKIVKLVLKNGKTLLATPEHPILTERGWVEAGQLKGEDKVAIMPDHQECIR